MIGVTVGLAVGLEVGLFFFLLWNTIIRASIAVRSLTQRIGGSGLIYHPQSSRGGMCWNVTLRRLLDPFSQTASAP